MGKDYKITRTKVTAKTRKLKATWSTSVDFGPRPIENSGWKDTFAWYPVTTVGGEKVWWQHINKRVLKAPYDEYKVNNKRYSKITQYGTDFDVLSGKYDDIGQYFPGGDLASMHGIDLEKEITAALSASICEEIDNEIVESMKKEFAQETSIILPNEPWIINPFAKKKTK